ncbi:SixA phosphatase family protein [Streptomyces eurythermus]|uniref:SixA phosphatase family protein n=1 Tax=Streptomyces eurythermus TaxID=42237 RepID=UPI003409B1EA
MRGPAGTGPLRRLLVLRHAKSAWPEGVEDRLRPLAPRGLRDAPAAGRVLAAAGSLPDLALCSTAVRARRTWELVAAEWATPPPVRYDRRLYAAGVPELLEVVREVPAEVRTLLLIGHNPGLAELVAALAADGLDVTPERVRARFPTSAIAALTWHGTTWRALAPGTALLTSFTVPRGGRHPGSGRPATD